MQLCLDSLKTLKPDIQESAARWDAFWQGEILDRPVLMSASPRPGYAFVGRDDYKRRAFGSIDTQIDDALHNAAGMVYGGDSIPSYWPSFAPDELAAYCGCEIIWPQEDGLSTNWAKPFVRDWEEALPLSVERDGYYFVRMQEFYQRCAQRFEGRILTRTLDFHSNMDLLSAVRGSENLCMDLYDCPEAIDRAMEDVRSIFRLCWETCTRAGNMDEVGYFFDSFATDGSIGLLSCDFMCMIGTDMFRRWVLPTMEYEAGFMDHVMLHWDGPGALKHFNDIMGLKKLYLISYVPSPGEEHRDYIELYQRIQDAGKAVSVSGTTEQLKELFCALDPAKTVFSHLSAGQEDTEGLISWMKGRM